MCNLPAKQWSSTEKKPFKNWSTIQDLQGLHLVKGKTSWTWKKVGAHLGKLQNRLKEGGVLGGWEFPSLKCAIALELAGNLIVGLFFFSTNCDSSSTKLQKSFNCHSFPRLPNTWWGGIWTPKTYLKHRTSGGIWKTRVLNSSFSRLKPGPRRRELKESWAQRFYKASSARLGPGKLLRTKGCILEVQDTYPPRST